MARKKSKPRTLGEKVQSLDPAFHESAMSFTREAAEAKVVELAKYQRDLKDAESKDMDLKSKQEQAREAKKGYNEQYKGVLIKTKFLLEVITSKGG